MQQQHLSPEQRQQRDIEAFMRHMQRQRASQIEIMSMIANAVDRVSHRTHEKSPAAPALKTYRKAQRRARAITRKTRK